MGTADNHREEEDEEQKQMGKDSGIKQRLCWRCKYVSLVSFVFVCIATNFARVEWQNFVF